MTGSEDQAIGRVLLCRGKGDQRCGNPFLHVVPSKHLCRCLGGLVREETPIVPDQHPLRLSIAPNDRVGQGLAQTAYIVQREAFANHCPPSASAKGDDVEFLMTVWAEHALLEHKSCPIKILSAVDAQDLVLIIDLVAFYTHPAADHAMGTIRQPIFAIHRRRGQRLEHLEDGLSLDHIGPDIKLLDLTHLGRGLSLLDDVDNATIRVTYDPPIGQRLIDYRRQEGEMGSLEAVAVEQTPNRRGAEEWRVAVEDKQITFIGAQMGFELKHRVSGPFGFVLNDIRDARIVQVGPYW